MKSFLLIFFMSLAFLMVLNCQNKIHGSDKNEVVFTSSNLPIVILETHGQTIQNEPKITIDMGIIYNGEGIRNNVTDAQNNYKGKVGIEIRGSSSQQFPKKQYAVELRTSLDADTSVSLLGLPSEADWILSAPYTDKTFFREVLTYWLSAKIGHYASRFKFCELVLNGEYMGVYILFEKIKRDKNRVNISKISASDSTGDNLTGGYILKIDKEDGSGNDGWKSIFPPYLNATQKIYWQYHYPKPEDIIPQQKVYIQKFIEDFETVMYNPQYADSLTGYSSIIDVPTFADYFLLNEMCKNVDSYRLSAFLYKDKDSKNPKLFMGPVWDYNLAWGNSDYYDASLTSGWHISYLSNTVSFLHDDQFQVPFWWKKLYADNNFQRQFAERWVVLRKNEFSISTIFNFIDSLKTVANEARIRNYQRWPILGIYVWPNYYIGKTYDDEITYFKNWITTRFSWMDKELGKLVDVEEAAQERPSAFELFQNYPNPFNPETVISYRLSEFSKVSLKIYDMLGNEMISLVDKMQQAGTYRVALKSQKSELSSGVYFYQLRAGNFVQTRKMILLR
ncbi:MAG: CotH kinase family protein [Ignavibacteriaceae bacterium]|jgi:hypothetical protein